MVEWKKEIDDKGDIIEVKLNAGKANVFNILIYNEQGDLLPSEPSDFTIIQGSKIGCVTYDKVQKSKLNKNEMILAIDLLKTELIDNFEGYEDFKKDVFTNLFDVLFDLGKEVENLGEVNEYALSKFEEINGKVKEIVK